MKSNKLLYTSFILIFIIILILGNFIFSHSNKPFYDKKENKINFEKFWLIYEINRYNRMMDQFNDYHGNIRIVFGSGVNCGNVNDLLSKYSLEVKSCSSGSAEIILPENKEGYYVSRIYLEKGIIWVEPADAIAIAL